MNKNDSYSNTNDTNALILVTGLDNENEPALSLDAGQSERDARALAELQERALQSFAERPAGLTPAAWLRQTWLPQYAELFDSVADRDREAQAVIETLERIEQNKKEIYAARRKGVNRDGWLKAKLAQASAALGNERAAQYASGIDVAMSEANAAMLAAIQRQDGSINLCPNLDGFIAEQHHASSFNIDAVVKGEALRAEVLKPDGQASGKNSVDIVIRDGDGAVVRRYQSKYGKDSQATGDLFERGDYRGQRKLVPEGQGGEVKGSVEQISHGDVASKPLSKGDAKAHQEKAQKDAQAHEYDWMQMDLRGYASRIGRHAATAAAIAVGFQAARVAGRRAWNWLRGHANPPVSEDMREFFDSSLDSAGQAGVGVAVAGAALVAARSGWLGKALKATPAGRVAAIASVALEQAKVLYKFGKGEMSGVETLDALGNVTATTVASIGLAGEGAAVGAALGTVFGPVGTVSGGIIGGMVGGFAGSVIGDAVYKGAKAIVKTARPVIERAVSAVGRAVSNTIDFAARAVSNLFFA
ncbi:hypothetical protein WM26_16100 [Burkholderia cepacia]|uniref:hypothetical protein n=1 Tax=Burkholderia cepacia TaxID=292 RepID=UPI00075FFA05|nr:hypothetical protein [Burkholderia cepacia]KWO11893.1 hypothetical protein WM26_16100 [Burkholderia cepacia]